MVSASNFLYGIIQSMSTRRYERAVIDSVGPNVLFIKKLVYPYSVRKITMVSIPQYTNAQSSDRLPEMPALERLSGRDILALEASGTAALNAPVLADGVGFRGGALM